MHPITVSGGHRLDRLGRGVVAVASAATLALAGGNAMAQEASPSSSPAGVHFASIHFPYTLELPPGWSVLGSSQDPRSDEDLFLGPDVSARVGAGLLEDLTQTVADRVADNRAAETASGECTSDPSLDRATTLGDSEAILWSWTCPSSHHVAINTIRDDLRLRLQVNVPVEAMDEAEPLLETLRQGFAFTGAPAASPDAVELARIDATLQGTWVNDWHPVELEFATLEAAGLADQDDYDAWREAIGAVTTAQMAVRFQDGEMIQYSAADGGPLEPGWLGTYRLLDEHTIEATETTSFNRIVYDFELRDDMLTVDVVSNLSAEDMVPQTAIFETLPFTRVP